MDTPAQNRSRSASLRKQVTGELALVPRGSQPTTSKRPPPHWPPAASGAARPGDAPACAVLTAPTADIATAHTATTTDRMIARGRGPPLTQLLAITHHPSAGRAPRDRLPSHLDVPADRATLVTEL